MKIGDCFISTSNKDEVLVVIGDFNEITGDLYKEMLSLKTGKKHSILVSSLEDERFYKKVEVVVASEESDFEKFTKMLEASEFGAYFGVSEGIIGYDDSEVETKEVCLISNDAFDVNVIFCKSDESYISALVERKSDVKGHCCTHDCRCGA